MQCYTVLINWIPVFGSVTFWSPRLHFETAPEFLLWCGCGRILINAVIFVLYRWVRKILLIRAHSSFWRSFRSEKIDPVPRLPKSFILPAETERFCTYFQCSGSEAGYVSVWASRIRLRILIPPSTSKKLTILISNVLWLLDYRYVLVISEGWFKCTCCAL